MRELSDTIHGDRLFGDKKKLHDLLESYQPHITVSKKQLKTLINDSLEKVHRHARALSLNVVQSVFLDRLSAISDPQRRTEPIEKIPDTSHQASESFHLIDENQLNASAPIPATRNSKDIIMEGIQELSQIMMADNDIETIAVMSLEILYRALDFQRALMFIQDSASKQMVVRYGYGHPCQQLIGKVNFQLGTSKDLFHLSTQVGKDVIVADSYDEKMTHLIPSWYHEKIDAPAFVFLPIIFQKACIGTLYADRDTEGLPMSETEHRYLGMLRNQLVLSIKYKQKSP